ncbi:MAG TPA: non-homologous end-joining DNA ligase [Stellaceae bacterium]|nr:non-homologous end-joining DNA ligase [Stellaceae bacterium]
MAGRSAEAADGSIIVAEVRLTHPDKLLYPEQGISKRRLAEYYESVGAWILPHIAGRPLSLVRCPAGQEKACFYQKHLGPAAPPAIRHVSIREREGPAAYSLVEDLPGLVALVQIGVLEIHPWGARAADVEHPDRLIFDLDPDPALPWSRVVEAAFAVRDDLAALGFQSFPKTTGGKGLHVVAPIAPKHGWEEVKLFARAFAAAMVDEAPRRYTINPLKKERVGRIFIDYLRNERGATAIAPYSTRARPEAPIAAPLAWSELSAGTKPALTLATIGARLARGADPWADMNEIEQQITPAARKGLGL